MKLLISAMVLLLAHGAFASTINVDCKTPAGFAGQSATMKGILKKSAKPTDGYYTATGKLKITVGGSTSRSLYNKTVSVTGAILDDGAISMISEKNPELSMVYVNQNRKDVSYVELNGKMFASDCTNSK